MKIKASGLGCLVIALIPLAFIGNMIYREYLESRENIECIKIGGIMKQTNKWNEAYQRNCINPTNKE